MEDEKWYAASNSGVELENAVVMEPDDFYKQMKQDVLDTPVMGPVMGGVMRVLVRGTVRSWTTRFGSLHCLRGKNLIWLQLFVADEQKNTQTKLYALGSRISASEDDSNVVERSRELFKDTAPYLLKDVGLWIFSRSMVRKNYNGSIDDALEFGEYDPMGGLKDLPQVTPSGVQCAEVYLFIAGDFGVPDEGFRNRAEVIEFLKWLDTEEGIHSLHAFWVVAAGEHVKREKLNDVKGKHVTVSEVA